METGTNKLGKRVVEGVYIDWEVQQQDRLMSYKQERKSENMGGEKRSTVQITS